MFEMVQRKVVPVGATLEQLTIGDGYLPIYQRALLEALREQDD